jgi:dTDP-4-dehydrorhamnose 3,5-epimerase
MKVEETGFDGLFILKPSVFKDERGYFFESYNEQKFKASTNLDIAFIQDNESYSTKGVLRGFHLQLPPYAQSKLVKTSFGSVLDVVVDLRKNSNTFGQAFSIELNDKNNFQLFVPKGFAHAFLALSDQVIFSYKVDAYYHKNAELGINYRDPGIGFKWPMKENELILSEKDMRLPNLDQILKQL